MKLRLKVLHFVPALTEAGRRGWPVGPLLAAHPAFRGRCGVSAANMRGKGNVDIANILPSVRARGILVPLMVRPSRRKAEATEHSEGNGSPDTFEIVAGKRRYHAALAVAEENGGECEPLPCGVLDDADDAAALEASLIENVARLDPDEVTRWETFTRLVKEGRSPEHIALTFGLTELHVKRTLALGNLLPRIRNLCRDEKIDAVTVKQLTLASKAQQRDWLAMLDDPAAYAPRASSLKAWLFGGDSNPAKAAIFDLATYEGELVTDLFGEDSYFASADAFWAAQNAAIEEKAASFREDGWTDVIVLLPGQYFNSWEYERRPKKEGGKVYIAVGQRGDVTIHEGYISLREARRQETGEAGVLMAAFDPKQSISARFLTRAANAAQWTAFLIFRCSYRSFSVWALHICSQVPRH